MFFLYLNKYNHKHNHQLISPRFVYFSGTDEINEKYKQFKIDSYIFIII